MRETIIGMLFIAALALVLYAAFSLGGVGSLGDIISGEERRIRIDFEEVTGLSVKDDVLVSGVRQGSVTGFELQQDGRVIVIVHVSSRTPIFDDAKAEMINTSALGGKAIAINPGKVSAGSLQNETILKGEYVPDFIQAAGKLMTKVDQGLDDVLEITSSINTMVEGVEAGEGPIGMLVHNQEVSHNVREVVTNFRDASASIRSFSEEMDRLLLQVNSGRGTLSEIIYNESLSENVKGTFQNLETISDDVLVLSADFRRIVAEVENGQGTLAALLKDSELRNNLKNTILSADTTLHEIQGTFAEGRKTLQGVNEGKGSAGKFFTDDTLYNDVIRTVNTLQAGFEDLREQAPVTTFASVVFQAFQ